MPRIVARCAGRARDPRRVRLRPCWFSRGGGRTPRCARRRGQARRRRPLTSTADEAATGHPVGARRHRPCPRLSYIEERGDEIAIGALARHHDLETSALLKEQVPLLAHTAHQVGDPQVRHRGTLGGTLAHGDPASDLPAAVLALGGTLVAQGPNGRREIAAVDFFQGFFETALDVDEMLVEIRVPKMAGAGWSFQKFNRRAQDWAIVGVAAVINGTTGVALVNMGPTPLRASAVEEAVRAGASAADAAAAADDATDPPSDINATSEYRRHLATVLVRRALEEATS